MMKAPVEYDWAWLAGFVDGEGCLFMGTKGNQMYPQLHIGNTNRPVMVRVANLLCAREKLRKVETRPGWRCRWHVCVSGAAHLLKVLDKIEKYLVAKRSEARIYRKILQTYGPPGGNTRCGEKIHQRRRELWEQMKLIRDKEWLS